MDYSSKIGDPFQREKNVGSGQVGIRSNRFREPCSFYKRNKCAYGSRCKFSHDLSVSKTEDRALTGYERRPRETPEQQQARDNYSDWKRRIKRRPMDNDIRTMQTIWDDANEILNGENRDWKQALPKDLDNNEFFGRNHMNVLMGTRPQVDQHRAFIEASRSFLEAMTHSALLNCLSVDTYVGSLYNFMSGANGTRAIPFFQNVCQVLVRERVNLAQTLPLDVLDKTLLAVSTTLVELLRREARSKFNEKLPDLISSLETAAQLITEPQSAVSSIIVKNQTRTLRAVLARASGLLYDEIETDLTKLIPVAHSTYPRDIVIPGGRHDNDHTDITKVIIFPTQAEILCDAKECLPSTDPDQPHFLTDKRERHIDTHFRLLRHDTFGKLKEELRILMKHIANDSNELKNPRPSFKDTRTYSYPDAFITYLLLNSRGDLIINMSLPQPRFSHGKLKDDIRKSWEESRQLEEGVLLSFIWIQAATVQHLFFTVAKRSTDPKEEFNLTHSNKRAMITIKLATPNEVAIEALLGLSRLKTRGILLEFPNILPATFVPVLENLQAMQDQSRLPFSNWIIPDLDKASVGARLEVPPPLYARHGGFSFSLDPILKPGINSLSLEPSYKGNDMILLLQELEAGTGLDHGQCLGLVAALNHEFAMIQGPPGTGKSYLGVKLMRVLLSVKKKAELGPVVVVCYTNHALDQFLEHLVSTGIQKVIRVGGQSQSDLLANHNLRLIAKGESRTKQENWQAAEAYNGLGTCETNSARILGRIHGIRKQKEWKYFRQHMASNYRIIYSQFNQIDDEGFKAAHRHPFDIWVDGSKRDDVPNVQSEMASGSCSLTNVILKAEKNVHSLLRTERKMLVEHWTAEIERDNSDKFFEVVNEAVELKRALANVHEEIDRRILQGADVIGLTTSGLAKNISTLRRVKAKIVICEEAGEVMEPHILSALLPSVEHFIQIGDHQQLRPSINNFEDLSLESKQGILYQLDRSQFERLSSRELGRPTMPVAQLDVQRRMRPEISVLIRETMYNGLTDHPSTLQLPDVVGIAKNVFWLDHDNIEDGNSAEICHRKSKSNDWEIDMVHALVRHLVRQGVYASSDIVVLTPYTGQLQKLRSAMRNDFEIVLSERDEDALMKDGFGNRGPAGRQDSEEQPKSRKPLQKKKLSDLLRVATVDNFQGEEAKIVIISLVRSNKEKKVGFLKTTNRINVLLSRAQHGMYLIGNADTYSNVPMWQKVIDMLRAKDSVGPTLDLCCPRHMNMALKVQQPEDFSRLSPEGGCREACTDRLPDCGHQCQSRCHSKTMHEVFRCEKPCQRRHQLCNHACQKPTCGEDCGECMVVMTNVRLPCNHLKSKVSCYLTQDLKNIKCKFILDKKVPGCGHTVQVPCYQDVQLDTYQCPTPCGAALTCGHTCPGTCGHCNAIIPRTQHVAGHKRCDKVCGRKFGACNHVCAKRCHDGSNCGLCMSQCEVTCKHSRCTLKCHEACAPCVERCPWSCPHQGDCTLPCSAPCNRLPCNERCRNLLSCGHQCPGLCGEVCLTELCKECDMKLDAQVDMIEFKEYAEINLDESPVVSLACGHFFTAETLDGMIGLDEVYKIDPVSKEILSLKDISSTLAPAIPKCPHCQCPIRQYVTQRYNRLINRAVIDEMSKRFIVTGQTNLQELDQKLALLDVDLEVSRPDITQSNVSDNTRTLHLTEARAKKVDERRINELAQKIKIRYKPCLQLRSAILRLQRETAERHQPTRKLYDATFHAMRRESSVESELKALKLKDGSPTNLHDQRIILGAKMLQARIDCLLLGDKLTILSRVRYRYGELATTFLFSENAVPEALNRFMQFCTELTSTCLASSLPKLAVQASICYAHIAQLFGTSGHRSSKDREIATGYRGTAKTRLRQAAKLCEQGFLDADTLSQAVSDLLELIEKENYEIVTSEELAAIKRAMVTGPGGIATHSGHWYQCVNGHPFAIGECGRPMQLARCPECGASIGGQNHQAVQGVSRAEDMEH